jgi:two-component system, NarL family, nitrate/nitrite response regulator NarL
MTQTSLDAPRSRTREPGIRVFLAEDHDITLWGLQRLIDSAQPGMRVVGTARTREALLAHPAIAEADVVLLDLDLSGEDGSGAIADLRRRCTASCLVLTGADDLQRHRQALLQGARGLVHKSECADTILRAIERVHQGEIWFHSALLGELTGSAQAPRPQDDIGRRIASLTPREREIVAALVRLSSAKQLAVAEALALSEHTLRNHLTTIYSKLGVRGRLELHVYASTHGLGTVGRDAAG